MSITYEDAKLELKRLNSKSQELDELDVFTFFTNAGLPPEVTLRLEALWTEIKFIGSETIHVGKIVIREAIHFIEKNPHLAIGTALGAALAAIVGLVPFLGHLLTPILMILGAFVGSRIDRGQKDDGWIGISQEVILLAKKFFDFFASVFRVLEDEFLANAQG